VAETISAGEAGAGGCLSQVEGFEVVTDKLLVEGWLGATG
jgi:hypothetical protein